MCRTIQGWQSPWKENWTIEYHSFHDSQNAREMRANQKRHYTNRRTTHKLQVGDLVLLKKHNADKMDLKWEPNYRVIKLLSPWSAVKYQTTGRTKGYSHGDLKLKHPSEDWELKPSPINGVAKLWITLTVYQMWTSNPTLDLPQLVTLN